MLALEPLEDAVVDRFGLPARVARADQEEVRVVQHPAQIELHHVRGLLVGRVARDLAHERLRAHQLAPSARSRYSRCSAM